MKKLITMLSIICIMLCACSKSSETPVSDNQPTNLPVETKKADTNEIEKELSNPVKQMQTDSENYDSLVSASYVSLTAEGVIDEVNGYGDKGIIIELGKDGVSVKAWDDNTSEYTDIDNNSLFLKELKEILGDNFQSETKALVTLTDNYSIQIVGFNVKKINSP